MSEHIGRLHVITNHRPDGELLAICEDVLVAGAPTIQLRRKSGTDRARLEVARELARRCASFDAQFIVNDRVDIAVAAAASGAHVGADDLPPSTARAVLGADRILGVTCRTPEAARHAEAAGADYIGAGPTYATRTKSGLPSPLGPAGIAAIAEAVDIPVVAVAGVDASRVREVLAAGAHGIAVVGAVFEADDPVRAVKELLAAIEEAGT